MLATFSILFPVFALIATGYISYKTKILGPASATELSRFVIWLALPALLFEITAKSDWDTLFQMDFIAVYVIGSFAVFLLVLFWRIRQGKGLAEASIDSMAASYANTGYIGFPLLYLVFGSASEVPTAIASIIVVSLLFGFAIILIESALHAGLAWHLRALNVFKAVFKNPLVFAPMAGIVFAATPYTLPESLDTFLKLLAQAASPAALISLGLFLAHASAQQTQRLAEVRSTAITLTMTKLLLQPLLVGWLAFYVFDMQTELAMMAVFLAALPTGTGPYMLAEFYKRDALVTAQTVLLSTVLSLVTLSILLHYFKP
ncbi:MAG: AEC family transporter [Thiotrichales bacterium]|nr:AEC family transporter [Thiotrichales bacterium]